MYNEWGDPIKEALNKLEPNSKGSSKNFSREATDIA